MDPDIKELLEKNLALSQDNNRMLRSLRRANRLAFIWRIVYIAFFVGGAIFVYSYVKPYLEQARGTYESLIETQTEISEGFGSFKDFLPR